MGTTIKRVFNFTAKMQGTTDPVHVHSGQFCPGHARDSLEQMVVTAISKGLHVFGLSEHMPRHDQDLYPEEKEAGWSLGSHIENEKTYFAEALHMRQKYRSQIGIPIGFECDWIRPESRDLIEASISSHSFDYFIGSIHHVHTVPIDYDRPMYEDARARAGGTDEGLFRDYFDAQFDMLQTVRPPIVGHLDLIRLKSDDPDTNFKSMDDVWNKVRRNLDYIASYGGILEINTAALRKGMREPYPGKDICQLAMGKGIRFCLSDDSHGIDQIAYGYDRVLLFLLEIGIEDLYYIEHVDDSSVGKCIDDRFPNMRTRKIAIKNLI